MSEKELNEIKKSICKIKDEDCLGVFCNITNKYIKVFISNYIDIKNKEYLEFLILGENQERTINMKLDRFKYFDEKLNITIIEILKSEEEDKKFLKIDDSIIKSVKIGNDILYMNECQNDIKFFKGKIKSVNKYFIYENEIDLIKYKGSPIFLNKNLIGLNLDNTKKGLFINHIINKINFIKCIYDLKKENINKEIQIINNGYTEINLNKLEEDNRLCDEEGQQISNEDKINKLFNFMYDNNEEEIEKIKFQKTTNDEIAKKVKILIEGKISGNVQFQYKFKKEGKYTVYILLDDSIKDLNCIFSECDYLQEVDFSSFNSKEITNMSGMFLFCSSLEKINFASINTEKVKNMADMFYGCSSLKNLNLFNFKTKNVKNMSNMFYGCNSLKNLDLSQFNNANVTDMSNMFYGCSSLEGLILLSSHGNEIKYFKTDKVTNMSFMFSKCKNLKSINLSKFKTDQVENMSYMFYKCEKLESINLSSFNVGKVKDMSNMFNGCKCKIYNLNNFNIIEKINIDYVFKDIIYIHRWPPFKKTVLICPDNLLKDKFYDKECIII